MANVVKRDYRSELRAEQAQQTRRRIVAAAAELFVGQGYGATTVDAIAEGAGVSRKTVFTSVGGKLEALKLALDWAIAGDDVPIPVRERPEVLGLLMLEDPVELLRGWAEVLVEIDRRVAALHAALEVAAGIDPAARALFETSTGQRLDGSRVIVDRLCALGALGERVTAAEATDIACLLGDPVLYTRLVRDRDWTIGRFRTWLTDTLLHDLLAGPVRHPGGPNR